MPSFDIVSKIESQEVDNAVNSVLRELTNRFDFKGANFKVEFDIKESKITISATDEYKLEQIGASLKGNGVKRGIDSKFFDFQKQENAANNSYRQIIKVKSGIEQEIAKKIVKDIKSLKIKVQASIRGEEIRVEGKKIDDLQEAMAYLKSQDYNSPLQFINFR